MSDNNNRKPNWLVVILLAVTIAALLVAGLTVANSNSETATREAPVVTAAEVEETEEEPTVVEETVESETEESEATENAATEAVEDVTEESNATVQAPPTPEGWSNEPVTEEEPTEDFVIAYDPILVPEELSNSHAFGWGTTIGYYNALQEACWGSDLTDAVANVIDRTPVEIDSTDPLDQNLIKGLTTGVGHAYVDVYYAADIVLNEDLTEDPCSPLPANGLGITQELLDELVFYTTDGVPYDVEGYELSNRYEGTDHEFGDEDVHDEGDNVNHVEGRTDAYHAGEQTVYHAEGFDEDGTYYYPDMMVAPCWGYTIDLAYDEFVTPVLTGDAQFDTGARHGGISAFADGISHVTNGTCASIGG